MLNFFKKRKQTTEEFVTISYKVDKNFITKVNIELADYTDQSIEALTTLLKMMSSDNFFIETVQFVKNGLLESGREDLIIKALLPLSEEINKKLTQNRKEHNREQPCIKPSDLQR